MRTRNPLFPNSCAVAAARFALAVAVCLGVAVAPSAFASSPLAVDTLRQWREDGKPALVVDVRSAIAFEQGHIEGAISVPLPSLPYRALPSTYPVVLVDEDLSGRTARAAAQICEKGGAKDVWTLTGGYRQWLRAGRPVIQKRGITAESKVPVVSADDLRETLAAPDRKAGNGKAVSVIELYRDDKPRDATIPGASVAGASRAKTLATDKAIASQTDAVVILADDGTGQARVRAAQLMAKGIDARVLAGGMAAWQLSEKKEMAPVAKPEPDKAAPTNPAPKPAATD